jgi:glycosyltransferase involved in cell wall biosynthesis
MEESVGFSRAAAMRLYTGMDRYCVERAHHIIAISNVIKNETMEYGVPEDKISIIHNGIDTQRFVVPEGTRERVRRELGLEGIVVGYIGRVQTHKNVADLVKAVVSLNDKDVSLMIVGEGDDLWRARSLASPLKDKAKFVGFVKYEEVPKYYAAADIIVYPTLYEPLGNVPLEAMASGRPILASNVDGIPEVFVKGAGYLIEPTVEDIQRRLDELVNDPLLRKEMGEVGRRSVGVNSWRNVARKTVDVCVKVLAEL